MLGAGFGHDLEVMTYAGNSLAQLVVGDANRGGDGGLIRFDVREVCVQNVLTEAVCIEQSGHQTSEGRGLIGRSSVLQNQEVLIQIVRDFREFLEKQRGFPAMLRELHLMDSPTLRNRMWVHLQILSLCHVMKIEDDMPRKLKIQGQKQNEVSRSSGTRNRESSALTKRPRRQCKKCPWRKDADPKTIPNGYCERKHRALTSTVASGLTSISSQLRVMACHESPLGRELPCVGWLMNQLGPGNNIGLRLAVRSGRIDANVKLVGEQHETLEKTFPR